MKNIFKYIKIAFWAFLGLIMLFIALVYFNKDALLREISKLFTSKVETVVKAKLNLDMFDDFPNISVELSDVMVQDAFRTDTLVKAERIFLSFNIRQIIEGQYRIQALRIENGDVRVKFDSLGNASYDIFVKDTTTTKSKKRLEFALEKIDLINTKVLYSDQRIDQEYFIHAYDSDAKLTYKKDVLNLIIEGDFRIYDIGIGNDKYFKDKKARIDLELDVDLKGDQVVIRASQIKLEKAKFEVSGIVDYKEKTNLDISISAIDSEIQTILSLLPNRIFKLVKEYKSEGNVYFSGKVMGEFGNGVLPQIDFQFGFNQVDFYLPQTKEKITNASLKGSYTNGKQRNGLTSVLTLKDFTGELRGRKISGYFHYLNFQDPMIKFGLDANFEAVYLFKVLPVKNIEPLSGEVGFNIEFEGKLKHLTEARFSHKLKTSGQVYLKDVALHLKTKNLPLKNFNGDFVFNHNDLAINYFSGEIGNTDFELQGYFQNVISYFLLDEQTLGINATFKSHFFDLDQLLSTPDGVDDEGMDLSKDEQYYLVVSPDLKFNLDCNIDSLKFRRFKDHDIVTDLTGSFDLHYQSLLFDKVSFGIANGKISLPNGFIDLNTRHDILINTTCNIKDLNVDEALYVCENFGQDFITNKNLKGQVNANIELRLAMDHYFNVDINSIMCEVDLDIKKGELNDFEPMIELGRYIESKHMGRYLKSKDMKNITFSHLTNKLTFEYGEVHVPHMKINSSVTDMNISGVHNLSNQFDYDVSFPLINYKRQENLKGVAKKKDSDQFEVYLRLFGTPDNFEVKLKSETINSVGKTLGKQFQPDEVVPDDISIDTTQTIDMDF